MNYLEIVLQGYFHSNNRDFLDKYFLREYKKAEKEQFFEADEFFNGCLKVIENWEKHLQDKVFERKRELFLMLGMAKNGTLSYNDMDGKTIEQKRQETIEYCEDELKDVRPDGIGSYSFTANLSSLTNGRIAYNMEYNEVLQIKMSILKAFITAKKNSGSLPLKPIATQKPELNKTELSKPELSDIVKKHFKFMLGNCPRKGTPILRNQNDFYNLVKWTTYFFENNFKVPEILEPIKSINTNDYFTQLAFLYLFDELRKSGYHTQRTRAKTLFNLWESCFSNYKGYSEKNFWKVKHENGNEVKKLMQIA
jgi:hypothetical protein